MLRRKLDRLLEPSPRPLTGQVAIIVQPPLTESSWLLGILGIAAGIFLFQRYRRRARLPEPAPKPQQGPDWLPWLALESKGPELLRPYDLDCIAPEDLPAFLWAGEIAVTHRRKTADRLLGDLRAWAAATALAPQPLDDSEALALRQVLGLELPPWTVGDLLKAGDDLGGRLAWSPRRRAELLNWLVQAEQQDTRVAYRSLLGKALGFWRARLRQERTRRQQRQNALVEPWQATLAEQRLLMERALLVLWQKPRWATAILYRLYGGSLQGEIHTRLGKLAAWEWHGSGSEKSEVVFLPWQWAKQTDKTRYLLGRMGFGREIQSFAGKLHIPSTLSLAAGLCGGLGVLALGLSVWDWWKPDESMLQPTLMVKFECKNGDTVSSQSVYVVGSIPELGSWNPANAVKLNPNGPYPTTWTGVVKKLPPGKTIQWKCIKRSETGDIIWQPDPNNVFDTPR